MRQMAARFALILLILLMPLASVVPPLANDGAGAAETDSAALQRARRAADALGSELTATLLREMSQGGAGQAAQVCSEQAQKIAASHSAEGILVRRVSLRARNPHDEPDGFERGKLQELEKAQEAGQLPVEVYEEVVEKEGRRLRYLRPLTIRRTCLQCHGDPATMPPEVVEILAERYPDDRAVGYEDGDLRGAISVTIDLD